MSMVGEVEAAQRESGQDGWWIVQHPNGATTAYRSHDRAVRGAVSAGVSLPKWSAGLTFEATK